MTKSSEGGGPGSLADEAAGRSLTDEAAGRSLADEAAGRSLTDEAAQEHVARLVARRDGHRAVELRAHARAGRLGSWRLGLAGLGLVLLLLPLVLRQGWPWWLMLPLAVIFAILSARQSSAERDEGEAGACRRYWDDEVSRVEERWRGLADEGLDLAPDETESERIQSLASDLDLFGPSSVFQLLSRASTEHGRRMLARWLLDPATTEVVLERHAAVVELRDAWETREALARAARGLSSTRLADDAVLRWGEAPAASLRGVLGPTALRVIGLALPVVNFVALGVWAVTEGFGPFLISALTTALVILSTRGFVAERSAWLSSPDRALPRYAALLELLGSAPLRSPRITTLRRELERPGQPPHAELTALLKLIARLEASRNVFFGLTLGPLLLWELNLVLRAEAWRLRVGPELRGWLVAIGELEALASLGAHADVRRHHAFPTLVEEPGVFAAEGLEHPLIDHRTVVANDLALGGPGSVLLLSGSNMSGKSTLLRSIGVAVVLAGAGAPVPARRLRVSRFQLETSIRVVDSLAQGTSHFYAELRRVRSIVEVGRARGSGLLYLLDEMLHGTNSRERYVGAVSVMRFLSQRGALGVVTTHDLELARVAEELPARTVENAHFGDDVADAKITFDYVLKPGPVRSTNALRLMRAMGIDIELSAPGT